jgi:hypothetical protein
MLRRTETPRSAWSAIALAICLAAAFALALRQGITHVHAPHAGTHDCAACVSVSHAAAVEPDTPAPLDDLDTAPPPAPAAERPILTAPRRVLADRGPPLA